MIYSDGAIRSNVVRPPMGTFLLIRKGDAQCAIRFTGMWRGNDRGESSFFNSGEESFRSRYVWYLGEKVANAWVIHPPKTSGESEVSQGRLIGLGKFSLGNGNGHIKCGSIRVSWNAPAYVYFFGGAVQRDEGNEIALTRWTKFEDVDPNDQSLQWLRYDENRPDTVIPFVKSKE